MIKYVDAVVTFSEIPDEITLCISISGCQIRCPDCHSKYLWEDVGTPLTIDIVDALIKTNKGISCICFMGGDYDFKTINSFTSFIRSNYPDLKTAIYSGAQSINRKINIHNIDYYKIGPYIKELGGLNSLKTNQILYKVTHKSATHCFLDNINYKFIKNEFRDKDKNVE